MRSHDRADADDAARACERDTGEAIELLLGAVEMLRRAQRVREEQPEQATWLEARQASYLLGLAEGLSAALATRAGEPAGASEACERAVAHAIGRALESVTFLRAETPVWGREVARYGGGELPLSELEDVLLRLASATARREGPLRHAGIKLTHLADGSWRASRRSSARRGTHRGDEGGRA